MVKYCNLSTFIVKYFRIAVAIAIIAKELKTTRIIKIMLAINCKSFNKFIKTRDFIILFD